MRFDIPGKPVAFAVSWPTPSRGYSYVIVDNGGGGFDAGGDVVFNYRAALDAKRRLDEALEARPGYKRSPAFDASYANAESELKRAAAATSDSGRGRFGQRALDEISRANDALLAGYGPVYARGRQKDPWIGLTVDDPDVFPGWPDMAGDLTEPFGWVRIVFDPTVDHGDPRYYKDAIEAADKAGLKILGEPIDSYFANRYTRAGYLGRMRKYVDAYPQVDAWEVGNEVNGCWVDSKTDADGNCTGKLVPANDRIANKIADSAAYVRRKRPNAQVVVTLYWQIGTDYAKWSVFNWSRANLTDRVRKDIDVVLLSQYVEDAPMGLAFDPVMRTLRAEFPDQRIGLGELDYWSSDTSRVWWAFARDDTLAGRRALAAHYYASALGYPRSVGGGFWWYFVEEMPGDPKLQQEIQRVVDRLRAPRERKSASPSQ
jgi:hypothetical protein